MPALDPGAGCCPGTSGHVVLPAAQCARSAENLQGFLKAVQAAKCSSPTSEKVGCFFVLRLQGRTPQRAQPWGLAGLETPSPEAAFSLRGEGCSRPPLQEHKASGALVSLLWPAPPPGCAPGPPQEDVPGQAMGGSSLSVTQEAPKAWQRRPEAGSPPPPACPPTEEGGVRQPSCVCVGGSVSGSCPPPTLFPPPRLAALQVWNPLQRGASRLHPHPHDGPGAPEGDGQGRALSGGVVGQDGGVALRSSGPHPC